MKWVFLSPHLDDVVFSCGGLVWERVRAGDEVAIWTICAGDPPDGAYSSFAKSLHETWQLPEQVTEHRRAEDEEACEVLGALPRHFMVPDAIYRRCPESYAWLYPSEEAIFGGLDPVERPLVEMVSLRLSHDLSDADRVVSPLGIGNHVDHELTRKGAHRLERDLYFYADFPYVREIQNESIMKIMTESEDWEEVPYKISPGALSSWKEASACYQSQIGLFWEDEGGLGEDLEGFAASMSGVNLWRRGEEGG